MDWSRYEGHRVHQPVYGNQDEGFGFDVDEEMPYDDLDPANHVYHERQDGMLCLRHALNSLVQAETFDDVTLGQIGRRLDEQEAQLMIPQDESRLAVGEGVREAQYNVSDDGNFSVQVMIEALHQLGLFAISYSSPESELVRMRPETQIGFICNLESHWFAIRKIGQKWFNLNSSFRRARQISKTYLSLFLQQLLTDNYSVYVISGNYPPYEKEELIQALPDRIYVAPRRYQQARHVTPSLWTQHPQNLNHATQNREYDIIDEEELIRKAIEESLNRR